VHGFFDACCGDTIFMADIIFSIFIVVLGVYIGKKSVLFLLCVCVYRFEICVQKEKKEKRKKENNISRKIFIILFHTIEKK
jgi:hypothetical protein